MFLISSRTIYKQTVYEVWNYCNLYFIVQEKSQTDMYFPTPAPWILLFRRRNSDRKDDLYSTLWSTIPALFSGFLWTSLSDIFSRVSIIFIKALPLSLNRCTSVWSCKTNNFQAFALGMKCHFNTNKTTDCMYKPR